MKSERGHFKIIKNESPKNFRKGKTVYTCPMHPEVKSDQPGKCPECGMNLVEMQLLQAGTPDQQRIYFQKRNRPDGWTWHE